MTRSADDITTELFHEDGSLDRDRLTSDAEEVMEACVDWLTTVGRTVFLPIDLLAVLLSRGHRDLERFVAGAAREDEESPVEQLRALARRVERESRNPARLHLDQFSLGFTGLLADAWAWAQEAGRDQISERDLARVMKWRAELQESASIRWALRQLAQPGGEFIFEPDGELRRAAFEGPVWSSLTAGMQLSARTGLGFLGTPHYVAALAMAPGPLASACTAAGVKPRRLHNDLLAIVGERTPAHPEFQLTRQTLTPRLVRMLIAAARTAEARGGRVNERDVLHAFLVDGGSSLEVATALGVVPFIRQATEDAVVGRSDRVSVFGGAQALGHSTTPTLDQLGRDLTAEARAGRLPAVLGRDEEIQQIINVLLRSEQRNPLLTGNAGVGKTALATALATRIVEGTVPERLSGMRVVEINGAGLVGGTSYRGELEARIQALLDECEDKVILFIDEAHAVFAPRSSSGQPAEIPNHFKAALASGKIAVVAATTEAEYRRWIEDDPALRRRFERIRIDELSPERTRDILADLAPRFEERYGVPVTPDAVDAAIDLSVRFVPEHSLPDKAKKLLMDATIAVASEMSMARGRRAGTTKGQDTPSTRVVTRLDVARQVARKTGAPLDRIARGAISWWVGLEERLARHVVGQDRAVGEVAQSLVASRLNAIGRRRPQAVFLLVGPPGVGKSAIARGLAVEVFGSKDALLTLEMSDFAEAHAISRLIGSPPGYVGYQDEDALVTPLRRRPSSVVLMQAFDMAHPRVQDRVVRIFADGEISDTRGLTADATHAVFVLTIDHEVQRTGAIGFGRRGADRADEVLERVDPELAARLRSHDVQVIVLDGLADASGALGEKLLRNRMEQFRAALQDEYDVEIVFPRAFEQELLDAVRTLSDARDLERVFRERVVEPVTRRLIAGFDGATLTLGDIAGPTSEEVGVPPAPTSAGRRPQREPEPA